jgi:four helix bundle protein
MAGQFRTFRDLECWKSCRELRVFVARDVLPALPRDEKYRLGDQLVRAARSTTANIAEGYGRYHYLDTAKFCSNARGSAYEVLDHLITAQDEKMISPGLLETGEKLVEQSVKLLNGYIHYLQDAGRQAGVVKEDVPLYHAEGVGEGSFVPFDSLGAGDRD